MSPVEHGSRRNSPPARVEAQRVMKKNDNPEQGRLVRQSLVPFGVALALSALVPLFAGSAVLIPLIAVMSIALIAGWILFVRALRAGRKRSHGGRRYSSIGGRSGT